MIYRPKTYVAAPKSTNHFVKQGDVLTVNGEMLAVHDVYRINDQQYMHLDCAYVQDSDSDADEDREIGFVNKPKPDVQAQLHQSLESILHRTPLPHLDQLTRIEHLLPLTSYFNSDPLLHHIEEHLAYTAYYTADWCPDEGRGRRHFVQLAVQYNCLRAFTSIVDFLEYHRVQEIGRKMKLNQAQLQVLVNRFSGCSHH